MNPVRYSGLLLLIGAAWPALAQKAIAPASPLLQPIAPAVKTTTVTPPPVASPLPAGSAVLSRPVLPVDAMAFPSGGALRPTLPTGKPSTEMPQTGGSIQDTKARNMDMPTGRDSHQSVLGEGGKIEPDKDGLIGGNVIKGSRYGDTFAGDKVNSQHRGDRNDFSGGGRGGQASMVPGGDTSSSDSPVLVLGNEKDKAPAAIPMSMGDEAGVGKGVASGQSMGPSRAAGTPYGAVAVPVRLDPKKREQDDAPSTGGAPMGRSDVINAGRAIGSRTGAAGGSGDGRGETDAAPSGGAGGMMRAQGTAGAAEKEDQRGATVSMEQMLKINTQVNPGAR